MSCIMLRPEWMAFEDSDRRHYGVQFELGETLLALGGGTKTGRSILWRSHILGGDKDFEVNLTNKFRTLVVTLLQQGTRVSIVLLSLPLSPAAGKVIVSDSFLGWLSLRCKLAHQVSLGDLNPFWWQPNYVSKSDRPKSSHLRNLPRRKVIPSSLTGDIRSMLSYLPQYIPFLKPKDLLKPLNLQSLSSGLRLWARTKHVFMAKT